MHLRMNNFAKRRLQLYIEMYELCRQAGWGDPFNYARSKKANLANMLGHTIASILVVQMQLMKMENANIKRHRPKYICHL